MKQKNEQEKIAEIKKIYAEYKQEIEKLKKEQDQILDDFLDKMEKMKLEEIRNKLK